MGCTCDKYCVGLKEKNIDKFINAFNEILKDYFHSSYSKIEKDECSIFEGENGLFWLNFEDEPLFATMEGEQITNYFVDEYIKKYPNEELFLNYQLTYNNCGDTTNIDYNYNPKTKVLSIKRIYGDSGSIDYCPECEEYFDEPLVYLEDYDENEKYICPYCGEILSMDVNTIEETKKIET